jgi:hypothetical protein
MLHIILGAFSLFISPILTRVTTDAVAMTGSFSAFIIV